MPYEAPEGPVTAPDIGETPAPDEQPPRAWFERQDTAGAPVVAVSGEIDLAAEAEFDDALGRAVRDAATAGRACVVVDLEQVRFFASQGVAVLLHAYRLAQPSGVELRLVVSAHPAVERVLGMLGLGRYLPLCPDRDQALSGTG